MSLRLIAGVSVGMLVGALAFGAVWLGATGLGMSAGEPALIVGLIATAGATIAHVLGSKPAV